MKQRISTVQLLELSPEQQERLREWWKPADYDVMLKVETEYVIEVDLNGGIYMISDSEGLCPPITKAECLPLLSIGQCIELLHSKYCDIAFESAGMSWYSNISSFIENQETELIDALFEAVKEVL